MTKPPREIRSLAAQLHPDIYDEGFQAGVRSDWAYREAEAARTALEDENQRLKLDLQCLEESTIDVKAHEQQIAAKDAEIESLKKLYANVYKSASNQDFDVMEHPAPWDT